MPVSKRDKKVSLTKTKKKGPAMKQKIMDDIRVNIEKYDNLFVFSVNNMRNGPLKEARIKWKGTGRFFFAKRRIMAQALGVSAEKEIKKDLHKIAAALLQGECGLFLTNKTKDEVVQWFESYTKSDYARSGFVATETVELPAGSLPNFAPAIEPHLRNLGMPTQLEKGMIVLREKFVVCTKGSQLTPHQAGILKLLKKEMAEFKMILLCAWSKDGTFEIYQAPKELKKESKNMTKPKPKDNTLKEQSNVTEDVKMDVEDVIENENVSPKQKKNTAQVNNETPNGTSDQVGNIPKTTPKQKINTPKNTPKQTNKTPNQQSNKTPNQQSNKTPNQQSNKTPNQQSKKTPETTQTQDVKTPNTISNTPNKKKETPKKQMKTPTKLEEEMSQESDLKGDTESELDEVESLRTGPSPKLGKANPRRSMRTPKPLKRTPEQRKMSVKKLTDSTLGKGTPKAKGTPRKAASARKSSVSLKMD